MKILTTLAVTGLLLLSGCVENSDGSDPTTYSSCSIEESYASNLEDQARDYKTCWDGVNYKEKNLATQWCKKNITTYRARHHANYSIKYAVNSTNCPRNNNNDMKSTDKNNEIGIKNYLVNIESESSKANGANWDVLGGKPDILIYIDNKYYKKCKNSLNCSVAFSSQNTQWSFEIIDEDMSNNDIIGKGTCHANETCVIGQATVKTTEY